MNNTTIFSKNINHIVLVADTVRKLRILERIDTLFGEEKIQTTKYIEVSKFIATMIIIGIGFANHSLYLVSTFFKNKPLIS